MRVYVNLHLTLQQQHHLSSYLSNNILAAHYEILYPFCFLTLSLIESTDVINYLENDELCYNIRWQLQMGLSRSVFCQHPFQQTKVNSWYASTCFQASLHTLHHLRFISSHTFTLRHSENTQFILYFLFDIYLWVAQSYKSYCIHHQNNWGDIYQNMCTCIR